MELPAPSQTDAPWHEIRAHLRRSLDEAQYTLWIEPLTFAGFDGPELVIGAPSGTEAWLGRHFKSLIDASAREVFGSDTTVRFRAARTEARARQTPSHSRTPDHGAGDPVARSTVGRTLNPRYSFDQFVIGDCNRLAHAAALAVAELPGQAYNPLFLHAPPGFGKTHLLHAIGNYIEQFGGGTRVSYTTVEEFTNHFLASLQSRTVEQFKRTYRDADVLLLDDVQFLASKAKTEEEFFHTFNALYETGRQLVFTADRLPAQLSGISDRLRERFDAGLVATIAAPDLPTRLTILRKRAALDGIELADPAVLDLIARRITDNVRALEGALIRIVAHHSLTGLPLDAVLATRVLDEIHPCVPALGATTTERIRRAVCDFHELADDELSSSSRAARVNWPRQVAMYLTRELTDASLQDIGAGFGGRSHGTVLHACQKVADQIVVDTSAASELTELRRRVGQRAADRTT